MLIMDVFLYKLAKNDSVMLDKAFANLKKAYVHG